MTFRVVTKDGIGIECESAADAILLTKALAADGAATARPSRRGARTGSRPNGGAHIEPREPDPATSNGARSDHARGWTPPARLANFYQRLNDTQRVAIRAIATTTGEIGLEPLRASVGLGSKREASIMISGCARMAKMCGLDWRQLVTFRITGARADRTSIYKAGPLLRGEVPSTK